MSAARSLPRAAVALGLAALLFTLPLAAARASDDETADSRIGVVLAAACGLSLKASLIAPVPWAGVAALSCFAAFLDAAMSPDETTAPPPAPPPTP
jgi:hypothetical protein